MRQEASRVKAKPMERGCSRLIERSWRFGTGFLGGRRGWWGKTTSASRLRQRKFRIRNRWSPCSFLRGRIQGKDHGGIRSRIRTPPRDGSIRFGSLDDLGLLRLSGITPNIHTKFPGATGQAAFENGVIGLEVVGSLDTFLHFGHGEKLPPVGIRDADQRSVDLVGNRLGERWGGSGRGPGDRRKGVVTDGG